MPGYTVLMTDKAASAQAVHDALQGWWRLAGVDAPPPQAGSSPAKPPPSRRRADPPSRPRQVPQDDPPKAAAPDLASRIQAARQAAAAAKTLGELKAALERFDAGPVKQQARHTVFARGNPDAPVMIIGEAPGREEDEQGKPFVGPSGQLLDKALKAAGFGPDDVYITNAFNWRPPRNRKPTADELAETLPFLERHIALQDPKIIILAGATPMQAVLGLKTGITRARGHWYDYEVKNPDGSPSGKTIPALPTFHPAFLLRAPLAKRDVWHDLQSVREKLAQMQG